MAFKLRTLPAQRDEKILLEVKKLAIPVILSNISRSLMNVVDVMMVGRLGSYALAATGMGSMIVWTVISFSIGLRTATQTVSSRRLGQKKYDECGVAMRDGHWKLVTRARANSNGPFLFDLSTDIGEQNNVASLHPDRVEKMRAALAVWTKDVATNAPPHPPPQ